MMYELFDEETLRKQLDIAQLERGRAEGEAKGRINEKINIAVNLLSSGISHDIISKTTGLPLERVKELAAQSSSARA